MISSTPPRDLASVALTGAAVGNRGERADGRAELLLGKGEALALGVPCMGVTPAMPSAHVEFEGRAENISW